MSDTASVLPPRILLIEDSKMSGRMLSAAIVKRTQMPVDHAESLSDARRFLALYGSAYRAAVVDIVLPDAADGEAIDLVCSHHIAAIAMTGSINEEIRNRIITKPIVDYVLKQTVAAVEYVANLVRRVVCNQSIKVLVVDDSASFRNYLCRLLQVHCLEVLVAPDGIVAQEVMRQHPDVRLVLVDHEMPGMNGVQLTALLRARSSRSRTCIIGVTGSENPYIGAQFLKAGADDILKKPFMVEEFYVRIVNHLDTLDHIQLMEKYANRDYLTGLYNRRYLYENAEALLLRARRENQGMLVAMVDIDFFKRINDTYGHESGDRVLSEVARCMVDCFPPPNLVARIGGEEFCVIAAYTGDIRVPLEEMRQRIETLQIDIADQSPLKLTVSVGGTIAQEGHVDALIARADTALYEAKQGGRNRVVLAS